VEVWAKACAAKPRIDKARRERTGNPRTPKQWTSVSPPKALGQQ
jgi:hypothetical protein